MEFRFGSAAFILVFATYLLLGGLGVTDRGNPNARDAPYNLLARGLLSGHLHLDKEPPAFLARLADPYDPEANRDARDVRERLNDLSYFRGRLYLYFGIAPALFLFIPWHLLTGGWMAHWVAVVVLCSGGLLISLSLVQAVRRRQFPQASSWLAAASVLLLGFASYAPLLVAQADLWEIPIAFGYLASAAALRFLWQALVDRGRAARWLALASAALGAAFASRPTYLVDAAVLLIPFAFAENRRSARAWVAAALPIALAGLAVAVYNAERFGSPFDFGIRYQLAGINVTKLRAFSPAYIGTNLRFYLLQPVDWSGVFPFAHQPTGSALPAHLPPGHGGQQQISGALLNAPILWAGLAAAAFIRGRPDRRSFSLLCLAAAWMAGSSFGVLSLFFGACARYQFEFVPPLALLAVFGIYSLEGDLAGTARRAARAAWVAALLFSSAFTVLYGIDKVVTDRVVSGLIALSYRDFDGAEQDFAVARSLSPANPGSRLGSAVTRLYEGRRPEARAALEALVRDFPDHALAHYFLGIVYSADGRTGDAVSQFEAAHRLDPANPGIAKALGPGPARAP